jgi:hypothetical protein
MPLGDGDPASDGDIWFRVATQKGHIVHGRVHHSAFGGRGIMAPPANKHRPWSRETSGRLRSLAGTIPDITQHAESYCAELTARGGMRAEFFGLVYQRVGDANLNFKGTIKTAVHFTPLEDGAHADLAYFGWLAKDDGPKDREEFLMWLCDHFQAIHKPQVALFPEAVIEAAPNDES